MTMKRFMAIHTFHSDETKAAMAGMLRMTTTQKEWAASWKFEKCQCVATWIGDDDFFFCHWLAETDEDIHNALRENGLDELVFTACYEANIHIDTACLSDERAFPSEADGTGLTCHCWMLWIARPPIGSDCSVVTPRLV